MDDTRELTDVEQILLFVKSHLDTVVDPATSKPIKVFYVLPDDRIEGNRITFQLLGNSPLSRYINGREATSEVDISVSINGPVREQVSKISHDTKRKMDAIRGIRGTVVERFLPDSKLWQQTMTFRFNCRGNLII